MQERRWLLPFTHGVEYRALAMVVHLAEAHGATLVPVSLIACGDERGPRGVRLEYIEQSKDFQEVVRDLSERFHVPIEGHEVFTAQVVPCMTHLIEDLHCDALVVISNARQGALLRAEELRSVILRPPAPLILLRMEEERKGWNMLERGKRLWLWYHALWKPEGEHRHPLSPGRAMKISSLREAETHR